MGFDFSDDSSFGAGDDRDVESDAFVPEKKKPATKTKAAPKKAATKKKTVQTTLTGGKISATKKRTQAFSASDDDDASGLADTPPTSKKQKKGPAKKAAVTSTLADMDNVSFMDEVEVPVPTTTSGKDKHASEKYQKLTLLEHVLKRPDTYIGSIEKTEQQMWVFNKSTALMEYRKISYVPGLYKIFDEILVNAADNKQNDVPGQAPMTNLKVSIDREAGEISIENNGKGIPVLMHEKENMYVPEMIFGHLLTGSNYNDDEKRTVGGRNGYGAKLCNVFSTQFTIELQDSTNGKRYKQVWTKNMSQIGKAKITSSKSSDFVRITFKPDFVRFGMPEGIDDDLESLLMRRTYDMSGTIRGVKVFLNNEQIKIKNFVAYSELYAKAIAKEREAEEGGEPSTTVITDIDKNRPRWEIGFTVSDGTFQQVSFVNNIATTSGGTHVNYIADQITSSLLAHLDKKRKGHALKQNHIRNHIFIFINCFIDNPAFTSQTKEQMTTKMSQFGSRCQLSDSFLKKIQSSEAIAKIVSYAEQKADKMLAKSDGNKRSRINNSKLVDANLAGTRHGHECTLILTEGDSAKSLAVAGRAILDPDRIGVFPLRGKMLNVRDASLDQITKNQEIQNIKQFMGLKHKAVYTDTKSLRYGHLMIMADQDHDGSHIKGLLINFLQVQFPSLLKIPNFFREFITPIVKTWQGNNPKRPLRQRSFFTQPEYNEWLEIHKDDKPKWRYKYFKGLGTSSNDDAQVYFTNLDDHLKVFDTMKAEESSLFELAFSKKKADARKEWLGNFVPGTYLDHTTKSISYTDFVNRELILFSMADNIRSIPSVLDGFKPGQRKVIYACFSKNIVQDMKVVELAGFVSGHTSYQHGEVSLQQTIIGLAQDFVGSNNINCLEPSGNFGSRLAGGSDAASARYIHTRLSPFARKVFNPLDEPILEHQFSDGKKIEPVVYAPVIPMVLVNGADGIGTGWSTSIPNFHPIDIVKNLKRRMGRLEGEGSEEQPFEPMMPWFRGWKGTPEAAGPDRFKFNGLAESNENNPKEVIITELPVRMWTDDFKARLEEVISGAKGPSWIKDYKEFNDHHNVHFEVMLDEKSVKAVMDEGILDRFKLNKQIATSNMVAFNHRGQIHKYENTEEIMEEFYHYRLEMYETRRKYWLDIYHSDFRKIKNQARFIQEIISGKLVVYKKKKDVLVQELRDRNYEPFPKNDKKSSEDGENPIENQDDNDMGSASDYDYLLSMPIWSLTQERLERLLEQIARKKEEYDTLEAKTAKDLWIIDLDALCDEWQTQLQLDAEIRTDIRRKGRRASKKIASNRGRKALKAEDDDYNPTTKGSRAKKTAASAAKATSEKAHMRFQEMFNNSQDKKGKVKKEEDDDGAEISDLSDGDFAALTRSKPAASKTSSSKASTSKPSATSKKGAKAAVKEESADDFDDDDDDVVPAKTTLPRRAAAVKASKKTFSFSDDESDDDNLLGDVGDMVKGIGNKESESEDKSRLSKFSMSSTGGSAAAAAAAAGALPKSRAKASGNSKSSAFDFDDSNDETNYEMLAKSSPIKPKKSEGAKDESDDEDLFDLSDVKPTRRAGASSTSGVLANLGAKKVRKPASASVATKAKEKAQVAKRPSSSMALSPAAKAYAAKKASSKFAISDDDSDEAKQEEEEEEASDSSVPVAKPVRKASASRTSSAKPAKAPAKSKAAPPSTKAKKGRASALSDDDDGDEINMADELDDSLPVRSSSRPSRKASTARKPARYIELSEDDEDDDDDFEMGSD
ncbi:DNA topoisomerase 2 [Ceratocystis lukuohia]|uniref:DNA topoisomerase 2 n=1 Tax=Ceratocystis lukuohia TaxID=2019550 RepID=A0ABR4M8G4_9PEZI